MTRISGSPPLSPPKNEGISLEKGSQGARQNAGALKGSAQKHKIDPQILEAAHGMEAMFLDTMFRAMRQTVQDSDMSLENGASKMYRSMLDSEVAQKSAETGGVGLAEQIVAYLEARSYNGSTGGSNEGTPRSSASRTGGTK